MKNRVVVRFLGSSPQKRIFGGWFRVASVSASSFAFAFALYFTLLYVYALRVFPKIDFDISPKRTQGSTSTMED